MAIDHELLEVLLLLQGDATSAPSASNAYIHVKYFDLLPDFPSRLSCDSPFFRFLRVKIRCKTRVPLGGLAPSSFPGFCFLSIVWTALSALVRAGSVVFSAMG